MSIHSVCFRGDIRKKYQYFLVKKKASYCETSRKHTYIVYNFDPLKPHLYIVKLGFTGVYIIFLISAQKYRLWVLVKTTLLKRF